MAAGWGPNRRHAFGGNAFTHHSSKSPARLLGSAVGGLLILVLAATCWSQDEQSGKASSIAGTVVVAAGQSQGTALSGVTVTFAGGEPSTISRASVTDSQSSYRFAGLSPGTYRLAVEQDGFEPRGEVVTVGDKQSIAHEIVLRLSRVTQQVDVQGQNSDILTETLGAKFQR